MHKHAAPKLSDALQILGSNRNHDFSWFVSLQRCVGILVSNLSHPATT